MSIIERDEHDQRLLASPLGGHQIAEDALPGANPDPTPGAVVMVRPLRFSPNPDTATDNAFQTREPEEPAASLAAEAYDQVGAAADTLRGAGITVHLFEEERADRPDAVFCNNWFSTHADGRVLVYPMRMPNRRGERRGDIIDELARHYVVRDVVDLTAAESGGRYLESTGAMVFDHHHGTVFIARSGRADEGLAREVCALLEVEPVFLDTIGPSGTPIYHTNVMMTIGRDVALAGLGSIPHRSERRRIRRALEAGGARTVLDLDSDQLAAFAGNMLELRAADDSRILAMSTTAERALRPAQRRQIEASAQILPIDVPAIETAGGSVRCMLADIHLPARP